MNIVDTEHSTNYLPIWVYFRQKQRKQKKTIQKLLFANFEINVQLKLQEPNIDQQDF